MQYFGGFLVLMAIGLWLFGKFSDPSRSTASVTEPAPIPFIHAVPPGGAAVLVAVVGFFFIAANVTGGVSN